MELGNPSGFVKQGWTPCRQHQARALDESYIILFLEKRAVGFLSQAKLADPKPCCFPIYLCSRLTAERGENRGVREGWCSTAGAQGLDPGLGSRIPLP